VARTAAVSKTSRGSFASRESSKDTARANRHAAAGLRHSRGPSRHRENQSETPHCASCSFWVQTPAGWPVYRRPKPNLIFFLFFGGAARQQSDTRSQNRGRPVCRCDLFKAAPPKNKKNDLETPISINRPPRRGFRTGHFFRTPAKGPLPAVKRTLVALCLPVEPTIRAKQLFDDFRTTKRE